MPVESSSKFFTITPVESKGLGVISKISIYRGTLILAESPLFTVPLESFSDSEEIIGDILTTKSTSQHTEFHALHNSHPDEGLTGIFKTNSLPCGDNDLNLESQPATEHGVFLVGSRFNSSCTPNVNIYWNFDSEEMEFRVMREIKAGEELSIAYCDILKTREERRKLLKERWGFDCNCAGCDLVTSEDDGADEQERVKMSDMRRTCVGGLLGTVAFGYNVDSTKLALRLLKQEGIFNFQETLSYDAYQLSTGGDQLEPRESLAWAKKAWKASCILTGINSPNSQRLLACYEDVMAQNKDRGSSKWDEDLDSDVLDELIEDEDDDGYYSEE